MRTPFVLLLVLVGTLASCTGLGGVPRPTSARAEDPGARPGGTITIGIEAPASIDPGTITDRQGAMVASLVCEPVVTLDPQTGLVRSGIAETVQPGAKGATVTIRLRDDVRFHDGSIVTAHDIAYALSRVARHDYASPNATVLQPVAGFGAIHAPPELEDDQPVEDRRLTGVRAISKEALDISLDRPDGEFLRALSLPLAAPVPRELPDRDAAFVERPVCAGPYQMAKAYRRGDRTIELRRFAAYYGGNDAFTRGGRGYPEVIRFKIYPSPKAVARAYDDGEVDIAPIPPSRETPKEAVVVPTPSVEFIGIPYGLEGFDDAETRATLSRALDREAIVDKVYGSGRKPGDRFYPRALHPASIPPACEQNVPTSGGKLGGPGLRGKKLTLKVNDDYDNVALARVVASQWRKKLGLRVRVRPMRWSEYLGEATSAQGFAAAFRESWTPRYPSFGSLVAPLFHSAGIGTDNWPRRNDTEFDRRLDRTLKEQTDPARQVVLYAGIEEQLCTELPLIPLTFGQDEYRIRTSRIRAANGDSVDITMGRLNLRELSVRGSS